MAGAFKQWSITSEGIWETEEVPCQCKNWANPRSLGIGIHMSWAKLVTGLVSFSFCKRYCRYQVTQKITSTKNRVKSVTRPKHEKTVSNWIRPDRSVGHFCSQQLLPTPPLCQLNHLMSPESQQCSNVVACVCPWGVPQHWRLLCLMCP